MKIRNVHARELPVSAKEVGALLDGLGGEGDRLWPYERWPTIPLEIDGPLAPGTAAGHGLIRYTVARYEPGRRLDFRFSAPAGLGGSHRFEIEPLAADRTVLRHVLEARVGLPLLAASPLIIRMHDQLLEDLLDNAQRAVGGGDPPALAHPRWMRALDAGEEAILRARERLGGTRDRSPARGAAAAGLLVGGALTAIAGLHAYWAAGGRWPSSDDAGLAETVVGPPGTAFPSAALTWLVTALLAGAATTVTASGCGRGGRVARLGAQAVGGVLLLRGVGGLASSLAGGQSSRYAELDVALYSPLSMALGAGALLATRSAAVPPAAV